MRIGNKDLGRKDVTCLHCKETFNVNGYRALAFKFCSRKCQNAHQPVWNAGKIGVQVSTRKGLILGPNPAHSARMKGRPRKGICKEFTYSSEGYVHVRRGNKYAKQHRVIMESRIGRELKPKEIVHHMDGEKKNNSLENLVLLRGVAPHIRLHEFAKRHNLPIGMLNFNQPRLFESAAT